MYYISKRFRFAAAHHLPSLPEGHKCKRPHGHNYEVIIVLKAEALDSHGFVMDYGDLAPVKAWIDATLDHRDLNEIMQVDPTAENLAYWLFYLFSSSAMIDRTIVAIGVKETDDTSAWYSSDALQLLLPGM